MNNHLIISIFLQKNQYMRNYFILIYSTFFINTTIAQENQIELLPSNFNGMYEAIANLEPDLGGIPRNSLVRIHIYTYPFYTDQFPSKIAMPSRKIIYPYPVLVYKEVFYHDKKGSKAPEREFYTGTAYIIGNNLKINQIRGGNEFPIVRDEIKKNSGTRENTQTLGQEGASILSKSSNLNIEYSNNITFDISLTPNDKIIFTKKKNYSEIPSEFSPYFNYIFNQKYQRSNKLILAKRGNEKGAAYIYANEINWTDSTLNVVFTNYDYLNSLKEQSISELNTLKTYILTTLENDKAGLHSTLMYFPYLESLKIHLFDNDINSSSNMINVSINREIGHLIYELELTDIGKLYADNATILDKERELERQKQYKLRLQEEQKAKIADEEKTKLYSQAGFPYKTIEFWNDHFQIKSTAKGIFDGDFNIVDKNEAIDLLFQHMVILNKSCLNLLPHDRIEIEYDYTTTSNGYSGTTYIGGGVFMNNYTPVTTLHESKYYIDPKFEKIYNKLSPEPTRYVLEDDYNYNFILDYISPNRKKEKSEYMKWFLQSLNCNEKEMSIISDNLFRYFNGQVSLQEEKGIHFD